MNSETTKTIFIIYSVVLLACLLLAIPGIIWGRKEKVVVYHGKTDLFAIVGIAACIVAGIVMLLKNN
jgi:hypothetical protein